MRYSLRTLLILMLLVGPLCIWGWPAFEAWRDERARVAKEALVIKRLQQSIAILDQQCRNLGGAGVPALAGTESIAELSNLEFKLQMGLQMNRMNALQSKVNPRRRPQTQSLLLFEGSAQELREHLGQPALEPSEP